MNFWPLIPAAANVASQALSKPDKEDYTPNLAYQNKYQQAIENRLGDNELYKSRMQPLQRQIGKQNKQKQTEIEQSAAQQGISGSGIEAQQKLSAHQAMLDSITQAHENAMRRQEWQDYQMRTTLDRLEAEKARKKRQAELNYKRDKNQWQKGMASSVLNLGGNIAAKAGQDYSQKTRSYKRARDKGLIDAGTSRSEYIEKASESGYPEELGKYNYALEQQNISSLFQNMTSNDLLKPGQSEKFQKLPATQKKQFALNSLRQLTSDFQKLQQSPNYDPDAIAQEMGFQNFQKFKQQAEKGEAQPTYQDFVNTGYQYIQKQQAQQEAQQETMEQIPATNQKKYETAIQKAQTTNQLDQIKQQLDQNDNLNTSFKDPSRLYKKIRDRKQNMIEQAQEQKEKGFEGKTKAKEYEIQKNNLQNVIKSHFPGIGENIDKDIEEGNVVQIQEKLREKINNMDNPEEVAQRVQQDARSINVNINTDQNTENIKGDLFDYFSRKLIDLNELKLETARLKNRAEQINNTINE